MGETLTADVSGIADADGLVNATFSYQWLADDSELSGAMDSSYTLADTDEGKAIKVRVSFTDDAGNDESLTSAATEAVAAKPNTPAAGAPTISGTAQVGETLTADTSSISDEDGLTNPTFSYRWIVNDGSGDADIPGATGSTYTLASADEGKTVKLRVTFTDDAGNEETLTSEPTVAADPQEAQAANSPATGLPTITGTAQVGETLTTDTSGIADEDGLDNAAFSYQWLADDTDITGATASTYIPVEADESNTISVRVSFTDDAGYEETLTSAATEAVTDVVTAQPNTPATGAPTISGTAQVGETLTADVSGIADEDGLDNTAFSYQWIRNYGSADADISGATSAIYTLTDADESKAIRVRVSFTDDAGFAESLTSASTMTVRPASTCPGTDSAPTPTAVEIGAVPIVVEFTTEEYFVLYVRHGLDADTTVEIPVSVTLGQEGTTTLTEELPALPAGHYRVEKFLIADPADVDGDCIDDITELSDPVGKNPLNPAPAISFVDGAVAIPGRETFEALSYKGRFLVGDNHLAGLEFVKFYLLGMDTDRPIVYFVNTETHRAHPQFKTAIDLWEITSGYLAVPWQNKIRGEMVYHPNVVAPDGSLGVYRYELESNNAYPFEAVAYLHEVLAASMPLLENNLAYYPLPARALPLYHQERALYDDSRVNLLLEEDILPDVDFIPLNREESYGFLRVMSLEERPGPRDIVIYETLPNELPRVGGIITTVPQTPLSHVNLRAVQDGVPNAFVRDALDDADIDDLIGGYVHYTVTTDGYTLRAATPSQVESHYAALRPAAEQAPERDLTVTEITALSDVEFDDWTAFGVKAANVAVLGTLDFPDGTVPDGFAVPFYFYDEFMKANGFYDDIKELLADTDFQSDFDTQESELKKLRKRIKKGETPEWIIEALEDMHATYPEGQSLRYRSSTNNEDLPGFSGAGLYDSKTQDPDETEEDGIDKSIKGVWASLWNFRAFVERDFQRIDHLKAAMGVLVHPNFSDELANGVAASFNPIMDGVEGYYVNTQLGEDLVTNPEAHSVPEEILLHQSGNYEVLSTSNQVEAGQLLMTDAQMDQLRGHLETIHDEFAELYGIEAGERFAMEIEFKITSDNILSIKQARPWVFSGAGAEEWTEDLTPGRQPSNLRAEATDAGIALTWDAPQDAAEEVTGYQILRRRPDQGELTLAVYVWDTGSAATSYTDADVTEGEKHTYRVRAVRGRELSSVSNYRAAVAVAVRNTPATGVPTITGTAQVGETLTADTTGIADEDGLTNAAFSYQWVSTDGSTDSDIQDATASTYTLTSADMGNTIKLRVFFTDDAGNSETLTSAATEAVAAKPNPTATGAPTISGTAQVGETLTAETSGIADEDGLDNVAFS